MVRRIATGLDFSSDGLSLLFTYRRFAPVPIFLVCFVSVVNAVARNNARHVPAVVPGGGGSSFGGLALQALGHGTGEAARAAEPTHVQGHAGMLTFLDDVT